MTTPTERTRAIRQAGELLRDIFQSEAVPEALRVRAGRVLRHYPEEWQLHMLAEEWQQVGSQAFGLAPEPGRKST